MKVLILGGGVIGVTTAWYLANEGIDVTIVERQEATALETSFANGGQISVCHAEPWASPAGLFKALRWMGREDAPLLFRLRPDIALLRWSLAFLRECLPGRNHKNIMPIARLAVYSLAKMHQLHEHIQALPDDNTPLPYDRLCKGIMHIYTDPKEFAAARQAIGWLREAGCNRELMTPAQCCAIEPTLCDIQNQLVGADFSATDESGDAHHFTQALASRAEQLGVSFRYNTPIDRFEVRSGKVSAVITESGDVLNADAYVVALGSYTPFLLKPLGIDVPVYPAKGYSATLTLAPDTPAPDSSIIDDAYKMVFSRLGNRLRIAGTAEFNGYNLSLNTQRCQALVKRTKTIFPQLAVVGEPLFWCGLRPATPSSLPWIGTLNKSNLWINSGHGTLGWTMACGSAALLRDKLLGRTPEIDFPSPISA